jgi:SsrA-binding protein
MSNERNPERYKDLIQNRKARHSYEITEEIEAGIELRGYEVKSLRESGGSIVEAYITNKGTQMFIIGMTIPPYSKASMFTEPSKRDRRLLLHRRQINSLISAASIKGMTLIPLKVYLSEKGIVKVLVGVGRGKALYDKRQDIKERDLKREFDRDYKIR